ncbi:hypothetical protein LSTR_LSTR004915 [Laodelphax striatellus]|uniref:Uncharacterized protein n=1 Tax=Laodelphax striatellus TaxID=195883 RepID=A0A482XMS4_LAOST|nr:hypothetical protein LSTR_LSTR016210 [Laodelphax striatellus]RZF47206.1 hypothetical protein LSTR_LSTR004915 [Laodelphax striatellus]
MEYPVPGCSPIAGRPVSCADASRSCISREGPVLAAFDRQPTAPHRQTVKVDAGQRPPALHNSAVLQL